jgi:hypothetical protein
MFRSLLTGGVRGGSHDLIYLFHTLGVPGSVPLYVGETLLRTSRMCSRATQSLRMRKIDSNSPHESSCEVWMCMRWNQSASRHHNPNQNQNQPHILSIRTQRAETLQIKIIDCLYNPKAETRFLSNSIHIPNSNKQVNPNRNSEYTPSRGWRGALTCSNLQQVDLSVGLIPRMARLRQSL